MKPSSLGPVNKVEISGDNLTMIDKNSCLEVDDYLIVKRTSTTRVIHEITFKFNNASVVLKAVNHDVRKPCYFTTTGLYNFDQLKEKLRGLVGSSIMINKKDMIRYDNMIKIEIFAINKELYYVYNGTLDVFIINIVDLDNNFLGNIKENK